MDTEQIRDALNSVESRWGTPDRVRVLAELSAVYERSGVIRDGFAPSLQECCPDRSRCWARAQDRLQPAVPADFGPGQKGSIAWPWVGDRYERPGGVCLAGLNINAADGGWWAALSEEYAITGRVIDGLAAGKRHVFRGSAFHYRAMASALAMLVSRDGAEPSIAPTPQETATAVERVARIQSVKCSPVGNKSYPTPEMKANCPSRFAQHELGVLQPGSLLALGSEAHTALELLGEASWVETRVDFRRGSVAIRDRRCEVFCLAHPTSREPHWANGQHELVESLKDDPLSQTV